MQLQLLNIYISQLALSLAHQQSCMSYHTYEALPVEGLYELLNISVRDLLVTLDSKEENILIIRSQKKQIAILLELIEMKRKETGTRHQLSVSKNRQHEEHTIHFT